jgi:hypothetical protein
VTKRGSQAERIVHAKALGHEPCLCKCKDGALQLQSMGAGRSQGKGVGGGGGGKGGVMTQSLYAHMNK